MSRTKGKSLNTSDYYPTPPWCYENLDIDWSMFSSAHEPCRGDGRIQLFLEEQGIPTTYSEILEDKDFYDWNEGTDLILTNPPFSLLTEFADHAIKHSQTCIFLLRLNFLESKKRHEWWKKNMWSSLHILSQRPSFTGAGTDATGYCWVVWDKTGRLTEDKMVPPASIEQNYLAKELAYTPSELEENSLTFQTLIDNRTKK
tara:strand:- start:38 stop:640 length:603 start_codon:yes stop_codon:yes gene_type:complete